MIVDVDEMGKKWGKWMRYQPNGWHRVNAIARMGDIGSGHIYARAAFHSDTVGMGGQSNYAPQKLGKKLKLGLKTNSWQISASGPTAAVYGPSRRNIADGRVKNFKIQKSKVLISQFMGEDLQLFHRGWGKLGFTHRAVIWTQYVPDVNFTRKVNLLRTTSKRYGEWLEVSHRRIVDEIRLLDIQHIPQHQPTKLPTTPITPLWPTRIFGSVHKFPIKHSASGELPVNGSIYDYVDDDYAYFRRSSGEIYAVISGIELRRLKRAGRFESYLSERRADLNQDNCHFAVWYDTAKRKRKIHNTEEWLRKRGLIYFEERLTRFCQELHDASPPWFRGRK